MDGAEVPAEEVLYWVSNYADQYAAWGMTDLSMDMGDGQTLGQYYLDSAVETATLYQLMQNKADELKLGWDKENQAAYDEQLQTMKESMAQQAGLDIQTQGDQVDTELVRLISYMGLSQEGFFRINQASFLYNNLMEGLFGAEGTDAPEPASWTRRAFTTPSTSSSRLSPPRMQTAMLPMTVWPPPRPRPRRSTTSSWPLRTP